MTTGFLLRQKLQQAADSLRTLDTEKRYPYSSIEAFVLEYGRSYKSQPLPSAFRSGQPKMCFANSLRMAERHRNELTYVEGYRDIPFARDLPPVHHAWCVDKDGKVYDRTLGYDPESEFFGIPFRLSYTRRTLRLRGMHGVLDTWEPECEIFEKDPEEFLA